MNMDYFPDSCSQYYSKEIAEFSQHPYDVEYPGLFHRSLSQLPMQQQPPKFVENLAMETKISVLPSTKPEKQLEYNNIVTADTNDDWMKELNAVEELLTCQEPESNYNLSSDFDSSRFVNELQEIIEKRSEVPDMITENYYRRANSDLQPSTGASASLYEPTPQQAPMAYFPHTPAMEATAASLFPSTNSEKQLGYNIRVPEDKYAWNMDYFPDSCSQYYSKETAEFSQHPYDVEYPGLFHPSLSQLPMQQQPPKFVKNLAMETKISVLPSTKPEKQLEYNNIVTENTNDDWMKELNAVEELLTRQEPESNYNMSSDFDSSRFINELQEIIEKRSEVPDMITENYYRRANNDLQPSTGASASVYEPTQQQASMAYVPHTPVMETTAASLFPSTNLEKQLEYNIRVPEDNYAWMKELNAVEERLMGQEPESNDNMSSDVDNSSLITELQQIIEGSSFESPSDRRTGANVPIQDIRWDQATGISPESCYWRANNDQEPPSNVAQPAGIPKTYSQKCNFTMVKSRRKRTPSVKFASLIDDRVLSVGDKASYMNKRLKRVSKQGRITREGIECGCCSKVYNISMFEAHAGSGSHRPAANIFLEDGRCLMDLQVRMVQNKQVNNSQQQDS